MASAIGIAGRITGANDVMGPCLNTDGSLLAPPMASRP